MKKKHRHNQIQCTSNAAVCVSNTGKTFFGKPDFAENVELWLEKMCETGPKWALFRQKIFRNDCCEIKPISKT
ncbi:hypothetical protein ACQVTW_31260, partial [Bacillus mycoides]